MGNYSEFRSRRGIAKCNEKRFFSFITDLRNFDRFVAGNLADWKTDSSHCSFSINPLGKITAEIKSSEPYSKAVYSAVTGLTGEVVLNALIEPIDTSHSGVTVTIGLELSPFLRIVMESQVDDYLERLIKALEEFEDYGQ